MKSRDLETNYYKIGVFVLIGISLIIAALLIFGSSKLFRPTAYIETYFDESVQGISEGSPVKYRGLQVGYVKEIAFTNEIYKGSVSSKSDPNVTDKNEAAKYGKVKLHNRSIYVKIALTSKLFTNLSAYDLNQLLNEEISSGLRVKLESQGLTGLTYLELNYVDPKTNPIPQLTWRPQNYYVPSAISTLTQLSASIQQIVHNIKDIDFQKLFDKATLLAESMNSTVNKWDGTIDRVDRPLASVLDNLRSITDNLHVFSEQLNFYPAQVFLGKEPPLFDPGKL